MAYLAWLLGSHLVTSANDSLKKHSSSARGTETSLHASKLRQPKNKQLCQENFSTHCQNPKHSTLTNFWKSPLLWSRSVQCNVLEIFIQTHSRSEKKSPTFTIISCSIEQFTIGEDTSVPRASQVSIGSMLNNVSTWQKANREFFLELMATMVILMALNITVLLTQQRCWQWPCVLRLVSPPPPPARPRQAPTAVGHSWAAASLQLNCSIPSIKLSVLCSSSM